MRGGGGRQVEPGAEPRRLRGAAARAPRRHHSGRALQVDSTTPRVESANDVCNQRLKLQYDGPLSNFAFNLNLRRYIAAQCSPDVQGALMRYCQGAGVSIN